MRPKRQMGLVGSITSRADQFTGSLVLEHTRSMARYATNGARWVGSGLSSDILRQMRYLLRAAVGSAILSMVALVGPPQGARRSRLLRSNLLRRLLRPSNRRPRLRRRLKPRR